MVKKKLESKPIPGDYVEVSLIKKDYQGILLESSEKGIILIKLDSGYNIGIDKKKILDVKIVRKGKEVQEKIEMKKDAKKPNVAMIITGGTIAARFNPWKGGVFPLESPEDLFKFYPKLFEKVNVVKVEVPFMKDSGEMDSKDWKKIAKVAVKLLNSDGIKGIIITHGTDSLHYTASALSFFLRDLNKPVVLTYAQKSIDRASSDANLNLQCAALAAISDMAEVMIVGHASVNDNYCFAMRGTKVRKMHSSRRDAFKSVNAKPLAKISPDFIQKLSKSKLRNSGKVKLDDKFEEKVALVKYYPGQSPEILDYYVKKKYKAIVLEVMGLGQIAAKSARNNWINKLKEVQKKGLMVFAVAQTVYGRLDPLVYSTGRELLDAGIIYLKDMLAETALVKLGWVLGHDDWDVKEKMLENFAGEFNYRLEE